ncbi:protein transport protein SEC61 subunit alpha homolog [Methanocella paludicola SANAE]|uniref:Protein translocase subunit SecY n=1 Tax=Methanocella paludicola (strain DSM 17711 / JCM 13418 / NBRC 101707 / SANAE) TaxID=304371 RepID=D1Z0U4_METPS|nr:preprotein translocase subunit SecY [Methanocella paludicola]BAI62316.1 protein transport protein SEC61 subunit alpha homolog [Methanocella paludicola SANAE]
MAEMGLKDRIEPFLRRLPAVKRPEKHVHFRRKLMWTVAILILYFVLSNIAVFGMDSSSQDVLAAYRAILAGSTGSIILLGIGPIVTASIVLQLLVGAEILPLDTTNPKDQAIFQGLQKLLVFVMIVLETLPQMFGGYLIPDSTLAATLGVSTGILSLIIFIQVALGGVLILYMDEVVSKWGIGSGVSLFIVAGVAQALMGGIFNWNPPVLNQALGATISGVGYNDPIGIIFKWNYLLSIFSSSQLLTTDGILMMLTRGDVLALIATIVIFLLVVYVESTRIEIPLSHAAVRGARGKFPVKLIYASVLPMILVRALQSNVQLIGSLLYGRYGITLLGTYSQTGQPQPPGLMYFLNPISSYNDWLPPYVYSYYAGIQDWMIILHFLVDAFILIAGGIVFAIFWVETTGMGSTKVAKQIQKSGMQIPGFRRNEQVIEKVVSRYIPKVTVIGGAFIGVLTLIASMFGLIGGVGGTGMLLAVSIIYQLYEKVASEQLMEMHPLIRRFLGEE